MFVSSHLKPLRLLAPSWPKTQSSEDRSSIRTINTIDCLCLSNEQLIGSHKWRKCYASAGTVGRSESGTSGISVGVLSSSISLVTAEIELPTFSTILLRYSWKVPIASSRLEPVQDQTSQSYCELAYVWRSACRVSRSVGISQICVRRLNNRIRITFNQRWPSLFAFTATWCRYR
jgi:hypothetical protein